MKNTNMPDSTQERMKQLDYLNLVTKFEDGKTIKLPICAEPANSTIRNLPLLHHVIIDTGADTTALSKEFLIRSGYGKYQKSGVMKRTITGEVALRTCETSGTQTTHQATHTHLGTRCLPHPLTNPFARRTKGA